MRYLLLLSACLFATHMGASVSTYQAELLRWPAAPTMTDTDGDGLDDELEIRLKLNPRDATDGLADADQDGLTFAEEWKAGTNPQKADSDGDGIGDLEEILRGTDPTNPNVPTRLTPGTALTAKPPVKAATNLLRNGDFSKPISHQFRFTGNYLGTRQIDLVPAHLIPDWAPVVGRLIEVWRNATSQLIELCATANDFGVKQELVNPALGGYVLSWKSAGRPASHGGSNHFWATVARKDGVVIATQRTTAQVETWTANAMSFQITLADRLAGVVISFTPADSNPAGVMLDDIVLIRGGLETDYNRDGTMTTGEHPPRGRPQRHWINDDQDETDCEGDDIDVPAQSTSRANWQMNGINGQRDLVDYFAVNLAISEVVRLLPPADGYRYALRQADRAVNFAFTSLRPAEASLHHERPGLRRFRGASGEATMDVLNAWVHRLSDTGEIPIDESWLARIEQVGHGLILVEGARETKQPLQVVVRKGGTEALVLSLPLEIVPVESMYRSVDVTGVCRDYAGQPVAAPQKARPTETGNPRGLPDAEMGDSWTVFVHGYNVNAQRARGWQAEVFKRLYAMGSRTRFVGVTWYGDTGVRIGGTSLDYHMAVFNALQTGDRLKNALGFLDPAKTTVMAHSLGNMVACQAIQKTGLTPRRYLMLNAAVPTEAFAKVEANEAGNMVEREWRGKGGTYAAEYFAANWHKRFAASDPRFQLKWSDLFGRISKGGFTINCYSEGDDIVRCPDRIDGISILQQAWEGGFAAWKSQELLKGLRWSESIGSWGMARDQAGWSRKRFISGEKPDIAFNPFFREFLEPGLTSVDARVAQALLGQPLVVYDLFARALPALSFGAGARRMANFNPSGTIIADEKADPYNYNLEAKGRLGANSPFWPTVSHGNQNVPQDERRSRWLHSDFRNAALPFVSPAFKFFVTQTN